MVDNALNANEIIQIVFSSITILITIIGSVVASVKFIIRGQIDAIKLSMQESCGNICAKIDNINARIDSTNENINSKIENVKKHCEENHETIEEIKSAITDISSENYQFREKEGKLNHEREIRSQKELNDLAFKVVKVYCTKEELENFKKEIKDSLKDK